MQLQHTTESFETDFAAITRERDAAVAALNAVEADAQARLRSVEEAHRAQLDALVHEWQQKVAAAVSDKERLDAQLKDSRYVSVEHAEAVISFLHRALLSVEIASARSRSPSPAICTSFSRLV